MNQRPDSVDAHCLNADPLDEAWFAGQVAAHRAEVLAELRAYTQQLATEPQDPADTRFLLGIAQRSASLAGGRVFRDWRVAVRYLHRTCTQKTPTCPGALRAHTAPRTSRRQRALARSSSRSGDSGDDGDGEGHHPGALIARLASDWGYDLDLIEAHEREHVFAELHADPDWGDQPWGSR